MIFSYPPVRRKPLSGGSSEIPGVLPDADIKKLTTIRMGMVVSFGFFFYPLLGKVAVGYAYVQFVSLIGTSHQSGPCQVKVVAYGHDVSCIISCGNYGNQHYFVPIFINSSIFLFGNAGSDQLCHIAECISVVVTVERSQVGCLVVYDLIFLKKRVHILFTDHQNGFRYA